ncbi:hypothetical protein FCV25MIE_22976 [Fagus crenata]
MPWQLCSMALLPSRLLAFDKARNVYGVCSQHRTRGQSGTVNPNNSSPNNMTLGPIQEMVSETRGQSGLLTPTIPPLPQQHDVPTTRTHDLGSDTISCIGPLTISFEHQLVSSEAKAFYGIRHRTRGQSGIVNPNRVLTRVSIYFLSY